ncbi:RPA-related protein RADX [Pelodytes ibericus]
MEAQLAEFDGERPGPSSRQECGLSANSGPPSLSWIKQTREQVKSCPSLRLVLHDRVPVLVLAVQRYLGEGPRPAAYYYDATLYDGVERDTWHLSPELGHLVQRNLLRCGIQATITRCSYRYLEKRLGSGLLCIEELELGENVTEETLPTDLAWGDHKPLQGDRKHYLPLWHNHDPYGPLWKDCKLAEDHVPVDVSKICSLQHLENIWRGKTTLPPLLVRIMFKSRLRYFGKPDKKIDVPYQAYFEVADHSGMMSLVLWNLLCPEWFNKFQIGRVILLQQYVVKKSYPNRTLPTPSDSGVKRLPSLEISLNARDPPSSINIINEKLVKPEWRLPAVKYQFVTRMELNDLPHNNVCDIIGLVTYVGRCERKRFADDSEDFWVYRWVQIIDGTTVQPFILEIFATSQPNIFEQIHPMSYLVCTQMRIIREDPLDSTSSVYLTTSNESQIFISGHHKGQPYINDHKVKNFIKWMRTQKEAEVKRKVVIGGYLPYPLTPGTFSKYCNASRVESVLTSFCELQKTIEHLHYREHKRVAVQGIIVTLRYVDYNNSITRNTSEKEALSTSMIGQKGIEPEVDDQSDILLPQAEEQQPCWRNFEVTLSDIGEKSSSFAHQGTDLEHSNQESNLSTDQEYATGIPKSSQTLWESDLWHELNNSIKEHLHYTNIFPESIPRKFDYSHKEILMQHYNLYPSHLSKLMSQSKRVIQNFSSANKAGHYELTILGINQNLAIDVIALPVLCLDNSHVFIMNGVPNINQFPCTGTSTNKSAEWIEHPVCSSEGEVVKFVTAQDRLHVICILDICHLGENKVEVCLNRIYNPVNEADAVA